MGGWYPSLGLTGGGPGLVSTVLYGGGGEVEKLIYETKKPKSNLLASNTRALITTKQTKPRPVASAAPHHITQ